MAKGRFEAYGAGLEPAPVNPLVVAVLAERGIDIAKKRAKLVAEAVDELTSKSGRQGTPRDEPSTR